MGRRETFKVKSMIPNLSSVVKNRSDRSGLDNFFKWKIFKIGSVDELVQVVHVGLVVFSIVILKCFFTDIRHERIFCVWKWWKRVFHSMIVRK